MLDDDIVSVVRKEEHDVTINYGSVSLCTMYLICYRKREERNMGSKKTRMVLL